MASRLNRHCLKMILLNIVLKTMRNLCEVPKRIKTIYQKLNENEIISSLTKKQTKDIDQWHLKELTMKLNKNVNGH